MKKTYPEYETCDLMHDGICVSKPCICKGMSISKKKNMKTEIDPMMEAEYMSWSKKQLIQDIQNKKAKIEELQDRERMLRFQLDICKQSLLRIEKVFSNSKQTEL